MHLAAMMIVVVLIGLASTANAQQEPSDDSDETIASRHKDWQLRCRDLPRGDQSACTLSQQLVTAEDRQFVLRVTVTSLPDGNGGRIPMVIFTARMGVYLPAGVTVRVDESEPVSLAYRHCINGRGCNAWLPLTDAVLETLRAGKEAYVTINVSEQQDFKFTISLLGFTAGYEELMERLGG